MDSFSIYLSVFHLQTLEANEAAKILDQILTNKIFKYTKFFTDDGVEFTDKLVKKMYKKHQTHWYTTFSKTLIVSPVEGVSLTLKNKIKRYISHISTKTFQMS